MNLKIGNTNTLEIVKETPQGLYLASSEGEILLPNKFIPQSYKLHDALEVFIYTDSEDRLIATTQTPKVQAGEFAALRVKEVTRFGAFLDWGLDKDLLLPYKEQAFPVSPEDRVVVRACLDFKSRRVIAVSKIEGFLLKEAEGLARNTSVDLMVYDRTPLGFKVVVDQIYIGVIYQNEIFQPLKVGDQLKGYIKTVREDGKLDIALQAQGASAIDHAKQTVIEKLRENEGFLPFHDNSQPEEIKEVFQMSKKNFKKAIGGLYKEGKIELQTNGIALKEY